MARRGNSKNELVKCPYCGEMYSVTYKHCPFCNEDGTGRWDDLENLEDEYEETPKGGKRLAKSGAGRRGAGGRGDPPSARRIVSTVVSLALMAAAACIVISIVRSFFGGSKSSAESPAPSQTVSAAPSPTASAAPTPGSAVSQPPAQESVEPSPVAAAPSTDLNAPTDFKLSVEDFTLSYAGDYWQIKVAYTPDGAQGDVTWKSSDPNIASVSWNGVVTGVSKGTATVTASVAGVGEKSCIVRCNFKDTAASTTTTIVTTEAPAVSLPSGLSLSREDFTLSYAGDSWRLVVSGTSSAVTWSSSKPEVAAVSSDGTVTAVGPGTCTITATVDGTALKCIVRCKFSQ